LRGLNSLAPVPVSEEKLDELAGKLGSDCPFFLHNRPMMMEGRGEVLNPISLQMNRLFMVLLFPQIHVSTPDAYGEIVPAQPERHLKHLIAEPIEQWKRRVINDFEKTVFRKHPLLRSIKEALYSAGAVYASLSGSGSSLYGLFSEIPRLPDSIEQYVIWKGRLPEF
jgi:4-diphosphocytidyl-2-C-methyl-D-erythritol kinase